MKVLKSLFVILICVITFLSCVGNDNLANNNEEDFSNSNSAMMRPPIDSLVIDSTTVGQNNFPSFPTPLSLEFPNSYCGNVDPYECGYKTGFRDVQIQKKDFLQYHSDWGTAFKTAAGSIEFDNDASDGYTPPKWVKDDHGTVTIVGTYFDMSTFNIRFYSDQNFQNRLNYRYYRMNNSQGAEHEYWRGIIDGSVQGIWNLNYFQ
ncbi:hypothetical protein PGH12_09710 [Chryseobacterium wangxinyae]|uniref:hypothetical protein n=1 Tax=Chryseobacterium sp. CY350 TaxID=2997336 RepID=UPI002271902B|nr:hypothetical protein [Chryseobacterium sp. CY350]MCY0978861.1 hypothetical protein [Chryseobacterium sp. CY350]WBZ93762.1 hypothetical protein PGH12_09710 [Chryseobacterium sp. CY350]